MNAEGLQVTNDRCLNGKVKVVRSRSQSYWQAYLQPQSLFFLRWCLYFRNPQLRNDGTVYILASAFGTYIETLNCMFFCKYKMQ